MKAKVYNQDGQAEGTVDLPEAVFGLPWNADLVHQVVVGLQANRRLGLAHAKDRGEVSGGGKKPWRQKGTGRARHGSSRSPLWRKGGVTHGPRNDRDYTQKINRKMRQKALYTILSAKQRAGQLLFLKDLKLPTAKTRAATAVLAALSGLTGFDQLTYRAGCRAIIAVPKKSTDLVRSFRNLKAVSLEETRNLNPLELSRYRHLILVEPESSLTTIAKSN